MNVIETATLVVGGLAIYTTGAAFTVSMLGMEESDTAPLAGTFWPIALLVFLGIRLGRRVRRGRQ